jgi:hypothetical protein
VDSARSALQGLMGGDKGGAGDPNAAGANGPFEGVYRALDVLKNPNSPWKGQFAGMSNEQLQAGVDDFQKGFMSDAAQKLIDVPGLIAQVKFQDMAEKSRAAFADAIAKAAGVQPAVTAQIMGGFFGTTGTDKEGKAAATPAVSSAVQGLATATATEMQAKSETLKTAGAGWIGSIVAGAQSEQEKASLAVGGVMMGIVRRVIFELGQTPPPTTPPTSGASQRAGQRGQ